ncbi:hypothetical protein EAG_15296 [Camponotus floridanus]|uniref:Uncharacterized protein n=1 Tax=Camponotus floridanus TaxID=104421 RepID=E2ANQ0_CAMFO|nr:uncharacterized protein LOC105254393 [Camponotus floridanus]XP_019884045.1 uncharacterized protein LOC105254393 [Camponotus floridanus]XP_025264551.1 uncharacterized protein LOC105254393 [Camponotus floridanus]EFN64936.1 hypothetical protein EAG_15296 [Camponotus floridanus]
MLNQRRRHSRWRMSLIFVTFLGLICNSELTPLNVHESSSSAPTAKRKSEDIGSLDDFTWQAWIMVDAQNDFQHGMDSATFLRRITPKSVFIAPPALPACPENYHADSMGRCVKSVRINENAQHNFLLQRLNAKYAMEAANNSEQKKSTGPLQLNIPLIPSNPKSSSNIEPEKTFPMDDPVVSPRNETPPNNEEKTRPHEIATASKYEMKNDTMLDEEETTFLTGNSSIDDVSEIHQKVDTVVPVTDLVEKTNDTSFSEVVDYKIPIDPKISFNASKRLNTSDVMKNNPTTEKPENLTETSSTLILLNPSTKLPSVANDLPITPNETSHAIAQISNVTSNETAKEVIAASVPDSALTSADKLIRPSIVTNETFTDFVYDVYEEEDAEYSTDIPDEEDLEEILRHGEAGMTIPTRNIERLHHDQQQNQTADQKKTLEARDQIVIHFNDSTLMPTEDKDEAGSNVSSEVSIDGDLILETTLLDVNTEKLQTTPTSPDVIRKIKISDDDHKESFSKNPPRSNTEPEVVFSHEARDTMFTSLPGRKRTEHLTKLEDKKNDKVVLPSIESLLYHFPEEDAITETRMTDKEQSTVKESTLQGNSKDFLTVPTNDFKRTTINLGSPENYVRFPDHVNKPRQDDYVRFPSSEANSIHSLGHKQPIDDVDAHDGTSTKSSVPVRQKPVYYLPSWKPERLQTDHVPTSERQKQRPDLFHFWNNMPLVRDPGVHRGDQVPDDEATEDTQELRRRLHRISRLRSRARFFTPEISSENVNRVFTPKTRLPIDD